MRVRSTILALSLLPAALFSTAAGAPAEGCSVLDAGADIDSTDDDVIICETANYLSCEDTLDPAGKLHDITIPVKLVPTAPDTSFTAAGGCGVPEVPLFSGVYQDTEYDFDIADYLTGNIDTLTFELHDIHGTPARVNGTMSLNVRITIDGVSPFGSEENTNVSGDPFQSPLTLDIPVELVASSTMLSDGMFFTITNLARDIPGLTQAGMGTFHSIAVTIGFDALDSTGIQTPVWGATEVPASITMNGAVRGTVIDATTVG
jgi:hypothetical protein